MSSIIYENEHYKVVAHPECVGEDGKYGKAGYAVVNKEFNTVEHTTMVLPQALFQADAFAGALGQLNAVDETPEEVLSDEDIILN
jgi:hypothetical protein